MGLKEEGVEEEQEEEEDGDGGWRRRRKRPKMSPPWRYFPTSLPLSPSWPPNPRGVSLCVQFVSENNVLNSDIRLTFVTLRLPHLKFGTLSVITCTEINLQSLAILKPYFPLFNGDCILSRRFALLLSQLNSKRQKEVHGHLQCFCQKGEYCINFSHNQKSIQNIPSGGFLFCQKGEYSINFSHNQISIEQTKYPIRWF